MTAQPKAPIKPFAEMFNGVAPVVIMCPPTYLEIPTPEKDGKHPNAKSEMFYEEYLNDPEGFREKAMADWTKLRDFYKKLGINVVEMIPTEGLVDQVYTADPAFTLFDQKTSTLNVIKSNFTNPLRPEEVAPFANALQILSEKDQVLDGITVKFYQAANKFEGTGDCYYDPARNVIFAGYTSDVTSDDPSKGRSDIDAHDEVEKITGVEVISLEVKHPCFHIDTCLMPLPSGHMLVLREGMTDEAFEMFVQRAFIDHDLDPKEYLIQVSENDALHNFVTNSFCYGNKIAMPQFGDTYPNGTPVNPISPDLINRLEEIGYEVTVIEFPQLIKLGGAMHCTSHMIMPKVDDGGLLAQGAPSYEHA